MKRFLLFFSLFAGSAVCAQQTEVMYLSGTGADHTVEWDFFCSAGMQSGRWEKIAVPSCWEQQGFGGYNYGHDRWEERLNETGLYRYQFYVPRGWKDREVRIVFDGVMTDALVKINGQQAGPVHQGAFYQFRYDISGLIRTGRSNQLEVLVKKHSDNLSVSEAERKADFWIFGGIFRPVYLEAKPKSNIQRVAVDARANGDFHADVYLAGYQDAASLEVALTAKRTGQTSVIKSAVQGAVTRMEGKLDDPLRWTPETPDLYRAVFSLLDSGGKVIHRYEETIGFRTVEVRESDGIYVNGVRIKMKGVNRHTFHPAYGRTSSKALSIRDVNMIKDMNMNAVRMSHYPPEKHFLDVCDSLGLFVLDELTAWQKPSYDDVVGRKLLEEMIARDVNHPSVILWDNGNEGGENNNLNDDFAELDIQRREVLHPWQDYEKTNTLHYIDYNYLANDGFSKRKIFFPTEFLHGLYDGGHGAGLEDYWLRMWNDPLCAGGFLWVFADESVERTDRNRELDSDGNHAPDGIVGPYLEKEGSFYTIREVWSPVFFEKRYITPDFDGSFRLENRYLYTNLDQCRFNAEWIRCADVEEVKAGGPVAVDLEPGGKGRLQLELPAEWYTYDALRITLHDAFGRHLNTWSWPVRTASVKTKELLPPIYVGTPSLRETDDAFHIQVGDLAVDFRKTDGTISQIRKQDKTIPLTNGPVLVSGKRVVRTIQQEVRPDRITITVLYDQEDRLVWTVGANGTIGLDVAYAPDPDSPFAGITFDFPEEQVTGMKWLGNGPYRVYKNRMKGVGFGLWEKAYNNTVTGESGFEYPEFKGYHANLYWVEVQTKDVPGFKVYVQSNDIFLRMLTPAEPGDPARTAMIYPPGDLSFLHGINAIGTKFREAQGPQAAPYFFNSSRIHGGKLQMSLVFDFNNP